MTGWSAASRVPVRIPLGELLKTGSSPDLDLGSIDIVARLPLALSNRGLEDRSLYWLLREGLSKCSGLSR